MSTYIENIIQQPQERFSFSLLTFSSAHSSFFHFCSVLLCSFPISQIPRVCAALRRRCCRRSNKKRCEHVIVVGAFDIKRWHREIFQAFELDFDFGD